MPTKTQAEPQAAYTLRDIPTSQIVVSENNPRKHFSEQELERLAHAISTRGFNHPILVKPTDREDVYEIVDGERRWRAAQVATVQSIPALVKARQSLPGDDLLDAMLANGLGITLDLVEEALGYQALISNAGYTRKGIAEAFKIPQARVRERLLILDLPEKLRQQVAAGIVPLIALKTLSTLSGIHPELAEVAVKRVLDEPVVEWDEPTTWKDLIADPISVTIGGYEEQIADLPADVFVTGYGYGVSLFALDEQTTANLEALAQTKHVEPEQFKVRFGREQLEQARALGAGHLSANETEAIIVGADIASQLVSDHINKALDAQREREQSREEGEEELPSDLPSAEQEDGESTLAAPGAPSVLSPEQYKAGCKRALEEDRRVRDETIAANQRLGAALLKHFGKVKLDTRALKILTAASLCDELSRIAMRGARLCFPGWAELSNFKNGATKAQYPDYLTCETKAKEYLQGASSAAEIAGRSLALLAAARWAQERYAIADSQASGYSLRFGGYSERGVPWQSEVADLLDEILIEKLPTEVHAPIRKAKEHREAVRAEEERRDRERDGMVAQFLEQAPSLTCDERHAEIHRLRREYGFSAIPPEEGRKLMELPEPDSTSETGENAADAAETSQEAALAA